MAVIKFTMFFKSNNAYGWSESHYYDPGSTTPNLSTQLANFVGNICTPRAALLSGDTKITFARAAYAVPNGIASLPVDVNLPGNGLQVGADESDSAAVMMFNNTSNQKKMIHMRGLWRIIITNEEFDFSTPEGAVWLSLFLAYKSALVSGQYGWMSKNPSISFGKAGVTYVEGNDGIVTFTLPQPGITTIPPQPNIEVAFSGFNRHQSVLNRTILCKWVDALTLKSVKQIGAGPQQTTGKYNYAVKAFVKYSDYAKIDLGTRKAGKVSGRLPGRSRVQVLY